MINLSSLIVIANTHFSYSNKNVSLIFTLFLITTRARDLLVVVRETRIDGRFIDAKIPRKETDDWDF